jgi:hypothetical protein
MLIPKSLEHYRPSTDRWTKAETRDADATSDRQLLAKRGLYNCESEQRANNTLTSIDGRRESI